jgi:hypothetical protein
MTNDASVPVGQPIKRKQYVRTPLKRGDAYAHDHVTNMVFDSETDAQAFAEMAGIELVKPVRNRFQVQVPHTADTRW